MSKLRWLVKVHGRSLVGLVLLTGLAVAAAPRVRAQSQSPSQQPAAQQQPDQSAPAAGGPQGDSGVIVVPKKPEKPDNTPPPAPAEPKFRNPVDAPNFSLRVEVPEVTVDVGVLLQKTHQFVPGLKPSNFRVYEDGVAQKVEGFRRTEAPITVLILMEYAARGYAFRVDALSAAWEFTQQLRPQDYVAMMTFDLNTHVVSDFTQDKHQIQSGINRLGNEIYMPAAFSETAIFDALNESLDRMARIQGQKYIVLIASGVDTMSKLTLDEILKRVKASSNISVFTVSTGGMLLAITEGRGGMEGGMRDMTYLQAANQMKTFADLTGGMHFEPRFSGELPDDMREINQNIRAKYELVYHPSNAKQDGTWRKIHVELVDDEGLPLRMQDEKHKPLKYELIFREGYRARQEVE
ncbi:MAG: VWA domain-containing protein [Terracidiphilus sp.]|jgi:VWFA-related protein